MSNNMPTNAPMSEAELQAIVSKVRAAVDALRYFARANGMDHYTRDPLVLDIHRAVDVAELARDAEYVRRDGWISVEERLPEVGERVLVLVPQNVRTPVQIDEWAIQREFPLSFSTASVPTGPGWCDHEFSEVSHWQPLPAPTVQSEVKP
jgi:hypothetical protein